MHHLTAASAILAALALAGCNKEPAKPKTTDEVVAAANKLVKPEPGQYSSTAKLVEFSVPGLPPDQADRLKSMVSGMTGDKGSYCLTKEEADKGFEEAVRKMGEGGKQMACTFDKFDVAGNQLDAQLQCKGQMGMTATMGMTGTVGATSSDMAVKMVQKAAMIPGGEMRMELQVSSQRTGDCTG